MRPKIETQKIYRIIDANFNRAKEGLRVCEDICRFVWDAPGLTKNFKALRHGLSNSVRRLTLSALVGSRDIEQDVGKPSIASELKRKSVNDIFYANIQRSKESLRVLEEFSKLVDIPLAQQLKQLRYKLYAIEQKTLKER